MIAFLAMKVGVDPRTIGAFVLLSGFVRSRPIALRVPPQSGEGERESGWRLGGGEAGMVRKSKARIPQAAALLGQE